MSALWTNAEAWIALALALGVLVAAVCAAMARSLFSMSIYIVAAGALAAAALLARGAGDAGLGQALLLCGITPVVLLACLLLGGRAAKPRRRGLPWLSIASACAAAGVMLWAGLDVGLPAPGAMRGVAGLTAWLTPLVFAAVAASVGLLGFGERGALQRGREDPP